jgi:hypothetical protein
MEVVVSLGTIVGADATKYMTDRSIRAKYNSVVIALYIAARKIIFLKNNGK